MSLFQCSVCGCVENTALSNYWWNKSVLKLKEDYCSACDPRIKKWHNRFERKFLEKGKWKMNEQGNLSNVDSGRTDYNNFLIQEGEKK